MAELGLFLKERRESLGLSLEQVQQTTKIQKRYIIAIEEGDYGSLPGAFYARAFVKTYAEALDLNLDELYETYEKELPPIEVTPSTQLSRKVTYSKASETTNRISRWVPKVLFALVVFLLITVVYYVLQNFNFGSDPATSKPPETNVTIDQNKDVAEEPEDVPEEETPAEDVSPIALSEEFGADLTYEIATSEPLVTEIYVKDAPETYVGVRDTTVDGNLLAPEYPNNTKQNPIVVEGAETDVIRIRIGVIGGIEKIVVNGRELELKDSPVTQNIFVKRVNVE